MIEGGHLVDVQLNVVGGIFLKMFKIFQKLNKKHGKFSVKEMKLKK